MTTRTALITGGAGGIGLAIARALGSEGYGVTLAGNVAEEITRAVGSLQAQGIDARGTVADVSKEQEVGEMVATHQQSWGRLDALVNSAGISLWHPLEEAQIDQLDKLLAVNSRGVILATREALPALRAAGAEHGKALIVNVSSITGMAGRGGLSVYAATKAAVLNFTHSTQCRLGKEGIQCTALLPGFVDTPMANPIKHNVPAGELIQTADVAEAVRFLLRTSPNCQVPELVLARPAARPDAP